MKILCVIDMQNDFLSGSLGSSDTLAIVPNVVEKIKNHEDNPVIVTLDTHNNDYLQTTLEGKMLPIEHCISGTVGHDLNTDIYNILQDKDVWYVIKDSFGSMELPERIYNVVEDLGVESLDDIEVEFCGVCTDICVISNALILRAAFHNMPISVDASCCAGTSAEAHEAALKVMNSCQIEITGDK